MGSHRALLRRGSAWALAVLTLAAGSLQAALPEGARLFDLKQGSVTYTVVHRLHEVKGTSQKLEGRALVMADGTARFEVRAPLSSFDSGNSNRDAHMREATHELQHPFVTVKGSLPAVKLPLAAPAEQSLSATLELNGHKEPVTIQARIEPDGSGLRAKFSFPFSLDAFKVDRPELLLMKVDDKVRMDGDLLFAESK